MSNEFMHRVAPRVRRADTNAGARRVLLLLALALGACGGSQVRLVAPDTAPGPRYTCQPGEGMVCQPATTDVPQDLNQSGTVFVILPRECKGKIHQIVVLDAGSSSPKVDATCAPQEEPIEEMSGAEPGSAAPGPELTANGGQ
jgi:hypothetical protein